MNDLQKAAQRLLSRGDITGADYERIEKTGAFSLSVVPDAMKIVLEHSRKLKPVIKDMVPYAILGSMALGGVSAAKANLFDPLAESTKMKNSYQLLQTKVPTLAGVDQNTLKDYFEVVKTYSPRAAANPLVAGSLIQKMNEFNGMIDHKIVQDLVDIESKGRKEVKKPDQSISSLFGALKAAA